MASPTVALPIINISSSQEAGEVGRQMVDAAAEYGFLYIDTRGTDLTPEVVEKQFQLSETFFASPRNEKEAVTIAVANNQGWSGMHSETLDPAHQKRGDFKECFNIGEFQNGKPQQPMPKSLQGHEDDLLHFETCCQKTCDRILRLLAVGLEIPDVEWFSSRHTAPSGCTVRLLHYPALTDDSDYQPEIDIRAGAHSDYGSITLLFQRPSQPGLEILTSRTESQNTSSSNPEAQIWTPVAVIPPNYTSEVHPATGSPLPPILVNIGDLLSYWTNNLLKSTVHRVIFPHPRNLHKDESQTTNGIGNGANSQPTEKSVAPTDAIKDRYSMTYFCHPKDTTLLEAVPSRLILPLPRNGLEAGSTDGRRGLLKVGYGGGADDGDDNKDGEITRGNGPSKGRVLTAREHLRKRLDATYNLIPVTE